MCVLLFSTQLRARLLSAVCFYTFLLYVSVGFLYVFFLFCSFTQRSSLFPFFTAHHHHHCTAQCDTRNCLYFSSGSFVSKDFPSNVSHRQAHYLGRSVSGVCACVSVEQSRAHKPHTKHTSNDIYSRFVPAVLTLSNMSLKHAAGKLLILENSSLLNVPSSLLELGNEHVM